MKNYLWIILLSALFMTCCSSNNAAAEGDLPSNPDAEATEKATVYVSTGSRSKDLTKEEVEVKSGSNIVIAGAIGLWPDKKYQTMDGFGAAVTGSTCYNLMKMKPEDRTKFLKETFSDTEGYGYSYIRVSIGCSDFSLSEYTCCDTPGVENFALTDEETQYVIPILKEILAINPRVKIMAAPWTCPRWMKVKDLNSLEPYNSWTSGQLNPKYYQDYATYFVKWVQAFRQQGIDIYAVTPQNEPLNRGNSASLYMGWDEEQAFVRDALGPQFLLHGITAKIYAYDHNYDVWDYPVNMYKDDLAASFLTGAAYHNYGGERSNLNKAHDSRPDMEMIFTETSIGMWNDGRNLSKRLMEDMREVALGTVNNWCKAVIVWNLMLDTAMGPNRDGGCQSCYGAVDIDRSDYKTMTRNSHYYIIAHLSTVIKPDAVRIGVTCNQQGITCSAFENTDGTYACVVMNENAESRTVTVFDGKKYLNYDMPAKSVASFRWKK